MAYGVSTGKQPSLEFSTSNSVLRMIRPARFLGASSDESSWFDRLKLRLECSSQEEDIYGACLTQVSTSAMVWTQPLSSVGSGLSPSSVRSVTPNHSQLFLVNR